MQNPIGWFEIYVQDIARAKKFYESVFQIKFDPLGPPGAGFEMWSFPSDMNSYGAGGALVRMPGMSSGRNSTLVYFSCTDCAVETKRILDAGGRIEKNKESIGAYGFIAIGYDSEDNMIGLHSMQ